MKKNYLYIYIELCNGEQMSDYFCVFEENLLLPQYFLNLYNLQDYDYDLLIFDMKKGVRLL